MSVAAAAAAAGLSTEVFAGLSTEVSAVHCTRLYCKAGSQIAQLEEAEGTCT